MMMNKKSPMMYDSVDLLARQCPQRIKKSKKITHEPSFHYMHIELYGSMA